MSRSNVSQIKADVLYVALFVACMLSSLVMCLASIDVTADALWSIIK